MWGFKNLKRKEKKNPWVSFLFLHIICLISPWIFCESSLPSARVSKLQRWTEWRREGLWTSALSTTRLLFLPSSSSAGFFCALLQERQVSAAVVARCWGWSWCQTRDEGTSGGCLLFCWRLWVTENGQWGNGECNKTLMKHSGIYMIKNEQMDLMSGSDWD